MERDGAMRRPVYRPADGDVSEGETISDARAPLLKGSREHRSFWSKWLL